MRRIEWPHSTEHGQEVIPVGTTVFERSAPSASVVDHSLDQTREGVFWIDDLPAALRPDRPPLRGTVRADLVVVGAGYTGLWTALLAKLRRCHKLYRNRDDVIIQRGAQADTIRAYTSN